MQARPAVHRPLLIALAALTLAALAFAPIASAQGTAPFVRTVIVNSGGTPAANGANLVAALLSIGAPGPADPWLVKVEPGIFDLGGGQLVMRNFVDIEGSGRNSTFILSSIPGTGSTNGTVLVNAGINAELRDLTVQNMGATDGLGIANNSTELKLSRVNIEVDSSAQAVGFRNFAGDPRLSAVFARVSSGAGGTATGGIIQAGGPIINEALFFVLSFGTTNRGLQIRGSGEPVLTGVAIVVTGASGDNIGLETRQFTSPRITDSRVTVSGGNSAQAFLLQQGSKPFLQDVTGSAEAGTLSIGAAISGTATVFFSDSVLNGDTYGVENNGGTLRINQSTVSGATNSLVNVTGSGANTSVGASQLSGGTVIGAGTTAICAVSYDGVYLALPPGC